METSPLLDSMDNMHYLFQWCQEKWRVFQGYFSRITYHTWMIVFLLMSPKKKVTTEHEDQPSSGILAGSNMTCAHIFSIGLKPPTKNGWLLWFVNDTPIGKYTSGISCVYFLGWFQSHFNPLDIQLPFFCYLTSLDPSIETHVQLCGERRLSFWVGLVWGYRPP